MAYRRRGSYSRSAGQRRGFTSSRSRSTVRSRRSYGRRGNGRSVTELKLVIQPSAPLNPAFAQPVVEVAKATKSKF